MKCDLKYDGEKLDRLARGELSGSEAAEVARHAQSCPSCAEELAWARTEQKLFQARTMPGLPPHAWQGIERRVIVVREGRDRRRRFFAGMGAMGTLAAAALTLLMWSHRAHDPRGDTDAGPPKANDTGAKLALDHAEAEYSRAIAVLDADWQNKRGGLPPERARRVDEELSRLKEQMKKNESIAVDLEGRRKALRTYSAYVRTVQAAVLEESP